MSECNKCGIGYFLPSGKCDHCDSDRIEKVTKTFIGRIDGDGESFMWSGLPRADRKMLVPYDDVDVECGDRLDTLYPCTLEEIDED